MLKIHAEPGDTSPIQNDQKCEQAEKTRHDPGKPHRVKLPQTDALETSPALERPTRDQETGNYKEHADAVISAPEKCTVRRWTNHLAKRSLIEMDTQVDVMQDHGNNAEPTQDVDALDALVWLRRDFDCGFRHR